MYRILTLVALLLSIASPTVAQTYTGVKFTPSSDHDSTTAPLSRYLVEVRSGSTVVRSTPIGKPTPTTCSFGSCVDYQSPTLFGGLAAGSYTVAVAAEGPGGVSRSGSVALTVDAAAPGVPAAPGTPVLTPGAGSLGTAIPAVIQAENFDAGGQNVSFYDSTAENYGGQLRDTAVDIERTSDTRVNAADTGYNIGWMTPGEWMNYTVSVSEARGYAMTARVSCPGTGGRIRVLVDGQYVTEFRVPNTGSWQTWQTVNVGTLNLSAGSHVIRLHNSTDATIGNLNWFELR